METNKPEKIIRTTECFNCHGPAKVTMTYDEKSDSYMHIGDIYCVNCWSHCGKSTNCLKPTCICIDCSNRGTCVAAKKCEGKPKTFGQCNIGPVSIVNL